MAQIQNRPKEMAWMERALATSQVAVITGIPGSGKSSLGKFYFQNFKGPKKWVSFGAFFPLETVGLLPGNSIDQAMKKIEAFVASNELIVWDDVHSLNPVLQNLFVHLIKHGHHGSTSEVQHLLISDENSEALSSLPTLIVGGFSLAESQSYLDQFNLGLSSLDMAEVFEATGGLPYLLQMYVQDPDSLSKSNVLSKKSIKGFEQILHLLAMLPKPLSLTALSKMTLISNDEIKTMQDRFWVEVSDEGLQLVPIIRVLLLKSMTKKDQMEFAKIILKNSSVVAELDDVDLLELCLQAQDFESAKDRILEIPLSRFESISTSTMKNFEAGIVVDDGFLKTELGCYLLRVQIQLNILLGNRNKAIQLCEKFLKTFRYRVGLQFQWLSYECISWVQKSNTRIKVEEVLSNLISHSKPPLQWSLKIEQIMPMLYKEPLRAKQVCEAVISEIKKKTEPVDQGSLLPLATAYFQLGTACNQLGRFEEALEAYTASEETYRKMGKIYFALFASFNKAWIFFHLKKASDLSELLGVLNEEASVRGYKYLQSGTHWLKALVHFEQVNFAQALQSIDDAILNFEATTPMRAKIDVYLTKAKILAAMGLHQYSGEVFSKVDEFLSGEKPTLNYLTAKLLTGNQYLRIDDFSDQYSKNGGSHTSDDYLVYMLERGIEMPVDEFRASRRVRLAWAQMKLIHSRRQNNDNEVQLAALQIEQILKSISNLTLEHAALHLTQFDLAEGDKKEFYLQKIESILAALSIDADLKSFFRDWSLWLQGKGARPEIFDPRIKERWEPWLTVKASKFTLSTLSGKIQANDAVDPKLKKGLVFNAHLGDVYFNKKIMSDFNRKSVLRNLLSILLDIYPHHISKAGLASILWGQEYDPGMHDARIYTSVQRLRSYLGEDSIVTSDEGYRWSAKKEFYYLKANVQSQAGVHRVKTLILEALAKRKQLSQQGMKRSELVEVAGCSDATAKRMLSELLSEGKVHREGSGPQVIYKLA